MDTYKVSIKEDYRYLLQVDPYQLFDEIKKVASSLNHERVSACALRELIDCIVLALQNDELPVKLAHRIRCPDTRYQNPDADKVKLRDKDVFMGEPDYFDIFEVEDIIHELVNKHR